MKMGFISYVILDFYTLRALILSTYFPMRHICSSNILTTVPTNKPFPNIYCITEGNDWSATDGKNITPQPSSLILKFAMHYVIDPALQLHKQAR